MYVVEKVHYDLGNVYYSRIRGERANNMEEAIRCYEQALEIIYRDSMPIEWAEAMANLAGPTAR